MKGSGCDPRAPLHPCVGSGPGEGEHSTVPFPSWERGAGSGLFRAEILHFALDEAIRMALTREAAKNPR